MTPNGTRIKKLTQLTPLNSGMNLEKKLWKREDGNKGSKREINKWEMQRYLGRVKKEPESPQHQQHRVGANDENRIVVENHEVPVEKSTGKENEENLSLESNISNISLRSKIEREKSKSKNIKLLSQAQSCTSDHSRSRHQPYQTYQVVSNTDTTNKRLRIKEKAQKGKFKKNLHHEIVGRNLRAKMLGFICSMKESNPGARKAKNDKEMIKALVKKEVKKIGASEQSKRSWKPKRKLRRSRKDQKPGVWLEGIWHNSNKTGGEKPSVIIVESETIAENSTNQTMEGDRILEREEAKRVNENEQEKVVISLTKNSQSAKKMIANPQLVDALKLLNDDPELNKENHLEIYSQSAHVLKSQLHSTPLKTGLGKASKVSRHMTIIQPSKELKKKIANSSAKIKPRRFKMNIGSNSKKNSADKEAHLLPNLFERLSHKTDNRRIRRKIKRPNSERLKNNRYANFLKPKQ